MKNWFTPRTLLIFAGVILLGLMVWRFSHIVAYVLIASVLSLIARPLVRLLGRIRIGKWQIPVSLRALVTLVIIWVVFFGFFRLFVPLVANEVQELSTINTEQVIRDFEEPIHRLELWINKLNLAGIVGMILAIPTYTVIRVFAKEFFNNFRVVQKLTEKI